MKNTGTRTMAQADRQAARDTDNGRYNRMNPCQCCGTSAGANYFSSTHTDARFTAADGTTVNFADTAMVLDRTCALMIDAMPIAAALAFMTNGDVAARRAAKRAFAAARRAGR